ncbi:hypothetical protein CMO88_02290 [Candidatus Woesearchaeota archaeon]|nr:hypothetical protein [Candidatus Woesearchaeota archaeon]|tara:strand:- start:16771 stop:17286 length:516 start_codon:yes stop_codon:yes gene_type:complete
MNCDYCEIVEKGEKLFEDDKLVVALSPVPASLGHVLVIPKEHFTILEQIPDFIAGHLFNVTNTVSTSVFETLRVHGINIIIENGISAGQRIAHFAINIVPRSENDGLGFNWTPKKFDDEEMSTVELQLKEQTDTIGGFEKEEKKALTVDDAHETIPTNEDDYMLKQLNRLP